MTRPVPHIGKMAAYQLADLSAPAGRRIISMAQNESLRLPSPQALEAARMALSASTPYPDPDWSELRRAISDVYDLDSGSILCGAGSMELIASLAHTFLSAEDEVLTSRYAYAFIHTAARFTGADFKAADETDRCVATSQIARAVTSRTKLVFVANPGNPTGTRIPSEDIRALRAALPEHILLVVDEAYGEFSETEENTLFDLALNSNTVILRTFSKAYGLAGMRVGWGVFPQQISEQVRKILNPNNVSVVSQRAATAAVMDQQYMKETCQITRCLLERFISALHGFDIEVDESHTNFALLRFKDQIEACRADRFLSARGILMRQMNGYGLDHCLRATIVAEEDMNLVIEELGNWRNGENPND